jgi:hypothetical protein
MNLRHAAALALVGWYLMTPPTTHPLVSRSMALVDGFEQSDCQRVLFSSRKLVGVNIYLIRAGIMLGLTLMLSWA